MQSEGSIASRGWNPLLTVQVSRVYRDVNIHLHSRFSGVKSGYAVCIEARWPCIPKLGAAFETNKGSCPAQLAPRSLGIV